MSDILAISLQALQSDATRLDRVSANLANATTPGYKREVSMQRPSSIAATTTFAGLVDLQAAAVAALPDGIAGIAGIAGLAGSAGIAGSAGSAVTNSASAAADLMRDMRVGTLKSTGQALDVALTGRGFFEVTTAAGPAYTRQGQFHLDARGRLVTAQGYAVAGIGGEIQLTSNTPTIDDTGAVFENGRQVAKLKVVDFDDAKRLQATAGGFAPGANAAAVDERASPVRQGYLENANVDSMREMVDLIKTMRHFESMQRVVQSYDDMLGTAIRKLGDA